MNTIVIHKIENDIKVICVTAKSFPDDVADAHQRLRSILGSVEGRKFYGISYPWIDNKIIYKAAVEESYSGEANLYKLETFTIEKGDYAGMDIYDYPNNMSAFSKVFQQLLDSQDIDPHGYCVEEYLSESNVRCMVKLKS